MIILFFFNDTATTKIYTSLFVGSVKMCIRDSDDDDRRGARALVDDSGAPNVFENDDYVCLLFTSPSPRDS